MRCLSCFNLSLSAVCNECHNNLFKPTVSKRVFNSLEVVSLFKYQNISQFLLTKHTPIGYRLYKYFAKRQIAPFLREFAKGIEGKIYLIGIDETPKDGYSHTAILAHYSRGKNLIHKPATLIAKNRVSYSGKSLEFRVNNPRDFIYKGKSNIEAILIDDIVTTGSTLKEAKEVLDSFGVEVLFAITLADAYSKNY